MPNYISPGERFAYDHFIQRYKGPFQPPLNSLRGPVQSPSFKASKVSDICTFALLLISVSRRSLLSPSFSLRRLIARRPN